MLFTCRYLHNGLDASKLSRHVCIAHRLLHTACVNVVIITCTPNTTADSMKPDTKKSLKIGDHERLKSQIKVHEHQDSTVITTNA
jgi:hypothetical protein